MRKHILTAIVLILVLAMTGCVSSKAPTTIPETTTAPVATTTEAPVETTPAPTETQAITKEKLTQEEAKVIALKHAQVEEADIRDLDIDLDTENAQLVYEISFETTDYDYDYHIDAYTGSILLSEKEPEKKVPAASNEADPKPEEVVSADTKEKISADKAKSIAFDHAKVKAADVRDLDVELDNEKGTLIYEISFEAGSYDYDYDIDAFTGKIIHSEKDLED